MRRGLYCALILLAGSGFLGCAAVNPAEVEQTGRDFQARMDVIERPVPEERYKIALLSRTLKHPSDSRHDDYLAGAVEGALAANLSNLGWFETVDRKNEVVIAEEAMLSGDSAAFDASAIPSANLILIAESTIVYVAKQSWKRTAYSDKSRGAEVVTDLRLMDLGTRQPLLVMKFSSTFESGKGGVRAAIEAAAKENVRRFTHMIAARFLPEGKVVQTRGDGRYALISIGKNYQLESRETRWGFWPCILLPLWYCEQTVTPGTDVEFVTLEEDRDGYSVLPAFAKGSVITAERKYAWVEVENPGRVDVMKNDCVRVAEPEGDEFD